MTTSRARRAPFVLVMFLAMIAGVSLLTAPAASAATRCFASSCTGLSPTSAIGPNGYYCSSDARTLAPTIGKNGQPAGDISSYGMRIELRYSTNCNAAWVRFTDRIGDACTYSADAWVQNSVGNRQYAPISCTDPNPDHIWQSFSNMVSDTTGQLAWACEQSVSVASYACTGHY